MTHSEYRNALIGAITLRRNAIKCAQDDLARAKDMDSHVRRVQYLNYSLGWYRCAVGALDNIDYWSERVAETANY